VGEDHGEVRDRSREKILIDGSIEDPPLKLAQIAFKRISCSRKDYILSTSWEKAAVRREGELMVAVNE
jgi:hypothetical protein